MGPGPQLAPLLHVEDVTVRFGGVVALNEFAFEVQQGTICGLIGPNGAGKTTAFNVLSRLYQPDTGRIDFDGQDLMALPAHRIVGAGISRTFQNLALWPALTVRENVMVGAHTLGRQSLVSAALRIGTRREERRLQAIADDVLDELGLGEIAARPVGGLPYGTQKRVELARALAAGPRLLLLDEPAAGLNHGEVEELAALVQDIRARRDLTVLLVEHHMSMVMSISDQVVVLDFGTVIADGPPEEVRRDPIVIAAYLGTADD